MIKITLTIEEAENLIACAAIGNTREYRTPQMIRSCRSAINKVKAAKKGKK